MGQRIIQTIYRCEECDCVPEGGETLWEMGTRILCDYCAEKEVEDADTEAE